MRVDEEHRVRRDRGEVDRPAERNRNTSVDAEPVERVQHVDVGSSRKDASCSRASAATTRSPVSCVRSIVVSRFVGNGCPGLTPASASVGSARATAQATTAERSNCDMVALPPCDGLSRRYSFRNSLRNRIQMTSARGRRRTTKVSSRSGDEVCAGNPRARPGCLADTSDDVGAVLEQDDRSGLRGGPPRFCSS